MPIKVLSDENSMDKISRLEEEMTKLTKTVDRIHLNSKKVKAISEKYKEIATQHLSVVSKYTEQKGKCHNLENIYKEQEKIQSLDRRVVKKQRKNVVVCYEISEALTYDFDDMNKDFQKLRESINTLEDMSEADRASMSSLDKQVDIIESLIRMEKSKVQ